MGAVKASVKHRHHLFVVYSQIYRGIRTQVWPKADEDMLLLPPPLTEPGIERLEEIDFNKVVKKQKDLRSVMQVGKLLAQRPERIMDVSELSGEYPSFYPVVRNYPGIFKVMKYGRTSSLFCFTAEAEKLHLQDEILRKEMETRSVRVLRKLLMLSIEKKLPLMKLGEMGLVLGLPDDFQHDLVHRYPQFFEVLTGMDWATTLSLTSWDPSLSVSHAEVQHKQQRPGMMSQKEMWLPKSYNLSKKHRKLLARFQEAPFVSPYVDPRDFNSLELKLEKHAVAAMQELLSLTVEKKIFLDTILEFESEFSFSHKPLNLILRHPHLFYVSSTRNQETVFLREAYHRGVLIKKNPLALVIEQLIKLLETQEQKIPSLGLSS